LNTPKNLSAFITERFGQFAGLLSPTLVRALYPGLSDPRVIAAVERDIVFRWCVLDCICAKDKDRRENEVQQNCGAMRSFLVGLITCTGTHMVQYSLICSSFQMRGRGTARNYPFSSVHSTDRQPVPQKPSYRRASRLHSQTLPRILGTHHRRPVGPHTNATSWELLLFPHLRESHIRGMWTSMISSNLFNPFPRTGPALCGTLFWISALKKFPISSEDYLCRGAWWMLKLKRVSFLDLQVSE